MAFEQFEHLLTLQQLEIVEELGVVHNDTRTFYQAQNVMEGLFNILCIMYFMYVLFFNEYKIQFEKQSI